MSKIIRLGDNCQKGGTKLNRLKLIQEIETLREQMHNAANKNGQNLVNRETFNLSLKLDKLITKLMKHKSH